MPGVPASILKAFDCVGTPEKLPGGEGSSYKVGHVVLKPVRDIERHEWASDLMSRIEPRGFRVSRPRISAQGKYTHSGWGAAAYEPGEELHGRWAEKLQVGRAFHAALGDLSPSPMPPSDDRWTLAHEIAWGETSLPQAIDPGIRNTIEAIFELYQPVEASNQVVHSDLCGNILFDADLPPVVIDFSPAYRPQEYALAILMADAVAWENAPLELIEELTETPYRDQMLIRAINFRLIVAALFHPMEPGTFEREYEDFLPLLQGLNLGRPERFI